MIQQSHSKHKVNMSADSNMQSKHISMQGLPYDKMKGLTPVSNKSGGAMNMKNGQLFGEEEPRQNSNSRNNHTRMPSLP
jgi:hypothetical protein